jgi:hypothetical protein
MSAESFDLPEEMWAEAAVIATYCVNIVPNSTRDMEIPFAVWHRELPQYSRLRIFGCAVLAYVDKEARRKIDAKAREAIFVGYSREKRGYRLLDSRTLKAFYSHTAVFYEDKPGRIAQGTTPVLRTDVSTQRYLNLDNATIENIPAKLNEIHDDDSQPVDSETVNASDNPQNLPGGADSDGNITMREARAGGAGGEASRDVRSGGAGEATSPTDQSGQKEKRSREASESLAGRLRGGHESESDCESRRATKKRRRGRRRRKAPTATAELREGVSCGDSPTVEQPSSSEHRAIATASLKTPLLSDDSSMECVQTSSCRSLREYVAPEGARTKGCPVTRSGRVSKPPSWFGDYLYVSYTSTTPNDSPSSSPSWEKAREEMLRAMAKEQALAWWQDYCCLAMSAINEPENYGQAMESEASVPWREAAQKEYDALIKNSTWELVPGQKHMKVLRNRWVFRVKYLANGEVDRFKARLVIKGFMQVYGVDYPEAYSSVVRLETLRVLLTLAAVWDYEIHQMDVTTAFLNGKIDVEVYMEQPEGFEVP